MAGERGAGAVGRLVVRVVVATLGVGCLVVTGEGAWQATGHGVAYLRDPEHNPGARRSQVDFESLRREFADQVPPGSRVYPVPAATDRTLWRQRLAEFAALTGSLVVGNPDAADHLVSVGVVEQPGPTGPRVRLVVRRAGR
ncbi:hypothetical protein DLJ47_19475 [Micromonospora sp. S4605]|nr:hypothetical protein DLJ47_19475 [Micromonospora sp. S4605]